MLEINTDVLAVAKIYIERLLMPNDADGDALHLAMASYHNMDVLLTWNCKHLANPNKFGHIDKWVRRLALSRSDVAFTMTHNRRTTLQLFPARAPQGWVS